MTESIKHIKITLLSCIQEQAFIFSHYQTIITMCCCVLIGICNGFTVIWIVNFSQALWNLCAHGNVKNDSEYILRPKWHTLNNITVNICVFKFKTETTPSLQKIYPMDVSGVINQYHHCFFGVFFVCHWLTVSQALCFKHELWFSVSLLITIYGQYLCQSV